MEAQRKEEESYELQDRSYIERKAKSVTWSRGINREEKKGKRKAQEIVRNFRYVGAFFKIFKAQG